MGARNNRGDVSTAPPTLPSDRRRLIFRFADQFALTEKHHYRCWLLLHAVETTAVVGTGHVRLFLLLQRHRSPLPEPLLKVSYAAIRIQSVLLAELRRKATFYGKQEGARRGLVDLEKNKQVGAPSWLMHRRFHSTNDAAIPPPPCGMLRKYYPRLGVVIR